MFYLIFVRSWTGVFAIFFFSKIFLRNLNQEQNFMMFLLCIRLDSISMLLITKIYIQRLNQDSVLVKAK